MPRIASMFLLLAVLTLSACASTGELLEPDDTGQDTVAAPEEKEPTPAPEEPTAADGDDIDACLSGECEIEVTDEVTLDFGGDYGIETVTLSFVDRVLLVEAQYSGGGNGTGRISGSGTVMLNNIVIRLLDHGDTTAIVSMTVL